MAHAKNTVADWAWCRHVLAAALVMAPLAASADESEPESESPPAYRNPKGSVVIGGGIGVAVGNRTRIALGLHAGYALLTGVVPGVRGVLVVGDPVGGEVAATLTLTPPLATYIVPFVAGEIGGSFVDRQKGLLYGGGGGLYLGEPESPFALQIGWMFRRIDYQDAGVVDASGPIISISFRF